MTGGISVAEKRAKFLAWVQSHKKQLILAGVSMSLVIGIVLCIKSKKSLMEFWALLEIGRAHV